MTPAPKPLTQEAETLLKRLNDGYAKIEAAESKGQATAFLENFWLGLLSEYEAVCQELNKQEQTGTQKGMFE